VTFPGVLFFNHCDRIVGSFPWSAAHNSDIERLTTSQALWASSG